MIPLTRLNGGGLYLNPDLVATVEEHHDTVVTLVDGTRLVVHETAQQVVASVVQHRAQVRTLSEQMLRDGSPAVPRRAAAEAAPASGGSGGDARVLTLRPGTGE